MQNNSALSSYQTFPHDLHHELKPRRTDLPFIFRYQTNELLTLLPLLSLRHYSRYLGQLLIKFPNKTYALLKLL